MEVITSIHDRNFDFNSTRSTPYRSAPSTPRRIGDYYSSAPSSPSRLDEFYREFNEFLMVSNNNNAIHEDYANFGDDFAFDVGDEATSSSVSADELFDGGMIKPMKPNLKPPRSPLSHGKKIIMAAFSAKTKKENDPKGEKESPKRERGRERSSSSRRASRSLSPLRVSKYPWEEEKVGKKVSTSSSPNNSSALTTSSSKGHKKWRLKDFFLFRSASEGRASDKDPLKKYTALFRRIDSSSTNEDLTSRRRSKVSAHELHYTTNRAANEELKKKTYLPYKQGILGRLAINPTHGYSSHK